MKEPYRHMEPKTEVKPSLYERLMRFAEENGVKRQLLVTCGAVLLTYAFIKLPYWFGILVGTMMMGSAYWKPDLHADGSSDMLGYSVASWLTGLMMMAILWGGYAVSSLVFGKKN